MPVPPRRRNLGWGKHRKGKRRGIGTSCGRRRLVLAAGGLLDLIETRPVAAVVEQLQETAEAAAAVAAGAGAGAGAAAAGAGPAAATAMHSDLNDASLACLTPFGRLCVGDAENTERRSGNGTMAMVQVAPVPPPCSESPVGVQSACASAQTEMSFDQDTCARQELLPDACMIMLPCEAGEPPAVGPNRQECVESMFGCPGRQGSLVGKYVRLTGMVTEAYAQSETVRVLWDDHETRSTVPVELMLDNQVVKGKRR